MPPRPPYVLLRPSVMMAASTGINAPCASGMLPRQPQRWQGHGKNRKHVMNGISDESSEDCAKIGDKRLDIFRLRVPGAHEAHAAVADEVVKAPAALAERGDRRNREIDEHAVGFTRM